jgi:hypothetical protein
MMMGIISRFVDYFNLNKREKIDDFDGHPFAIVTGLCSDYRHFADEYSLITGSEMQVEGIFWSLEGFESHSYYGSNFEIIFNPDYEFDEPKQEDKCIIEVV